MTGGAGVAGRGVEVPAVTRQVSRRALLAVASFGALLAFLDTTIVNVVFPDIRASFPSSSIGALSWVLNAYNVVFAAFLVAAGRFADLLGRRRIFTTGVVVFTAASGLCAAAGSLDVLILGRAFQALGAALLVPASLGLVVQAFPGERRSHAVGLWGAAAAAAAGLGPPIGGALVAIDSWRLAFLINLPLGLLAVVAGRRVLIESRAPGRRTRPDLVGAILQALALALVTLAIVEGADWGWASPGVLAAIAAGCAAAALFVASSRRHPSPVLDPKLLRTRTFAVANLLTLVAGVGFYAYLLNNILWLHYVWGWSLLRSGLAVAPAALVAVLIARRLSRLADEKGHRGIAAVGALVWTGAYVWYATRVGTSPAFLSDWLPGQVLSGIGVAATLPILGGAALSAVPGGRFATSSAVVTSTRQLGGALGVALLVVLIGTPAETTLASHIRHGWWMSAACFAFVAAGALFLRREPQAEIERDETGLGPVLKVPRRVAVRRRRSPDWQLTRILARLPESAQEEMVRTSEQVALAAGEVLFRAGDEPDGMYLVVTGRLEIVVRGAVIGELGNGEVVGELGLLADTPRAADVRARRDSRLLRISADRFHALLGADAAAQRTLVAALASQLQEQASLFSARALEPTVVAVVGAGDAPTERVAAMLVESLSRHLLVVNPGVVDADGLDRAEREHDRVVIVAGSQDDEDWHDFCRRQADLLLLVGDGKSSPSDIVPNRHCYVLLVGANVSRDRLVGWHDAFSPRHLMVCTGADLAAGVEVIADRICGRSLGLVLAGGGARALAAIGVLEELERADVRVDRIAGTSVGSVVASLYAAGHSPTEIDAICFDEFVRRRPFDYTVPRVAVLRGKRLQDALERRLCDKLFEELPRQLAVVSTDLLARRAVVHRRGLVREAVRASIALPGLYPPARLGNQLHVDGGLLDNLPIDALDADEGPLVAVNIAAAGSLRPRPGAPKMPGLPEVLLRSLLIGGVPANEDARRMPAIIVTPDTRGIGLFEFHQLDRAIEAGRAAGAAVVEVLRTGKASASGGNPTDTEQPG